MSYNEYNSFDYFLDILVKNPDTNENEEIQSDEDECEEECTEGGPTDKDISGGTFENTKCVSVESGDTLSSILDKEGVSPRDIDLISKKLAKATSLRCLQIGQKIDLYFEKDANNEQRLTGLFLCDKIGNKITISMKDNDCGLSLHKRVLQTIFKRAGGVVSSNFYNAASREGIPQSVVNEAKKAISFLGYNISNGKAFEILYEEKVDAESLRSVGERNLKYISVLLNGKIYKVYRYGKDGYYNENGENLKKESLIVPLKNKVVRISSKFGSRRHPILNVVHVHKGVDYAAKYGSVVCSAAKGRVIKAGRNGSYGLYILIRHANGIETGYAHLCSILVKPGMTVSQGQEIGRVGRTGRTTGAHLHHEVTLNKRHVDPQKYHSIGGTKLVGTEYEKFKKQQRELSVKLVGMTEKRHIA